MNRKVIYCKLVAIKEGQYTIYVFKEEDKYVMCTKLPNWQTPDIVVGDKGYLSYVEVSAGEEYYNPSTETRHTYNYSNVYFENFILKQKVKNSELIL